VSNKANHAEKKPTGMSKDKNPAEKYPATKNKSIHVGV